MSARSTDIKNILRLLHIARHDPTEAGRLLEGLVEVGDGVVGTLIAELDSADAEVRSGAALALGYVSFYSDGRCDVSPALPALHRLAENGDSWAAFHAAKSLWTICVERGLDANDVVGRIAACIHSRDPQVRVAAAEQLGRTGRFAEPPIPQLIDCLDDPAVDVACAAAESLSRFGAAVIGAVPTLMEWVSSENPAKRFYGSVAVIQIDEAYRAALVPVLLDALESLDEPFREKAVYAIGWITEIADQVVPVLARWYMPTEDRGVRLAVVSVLAGYGPDVREALPVLVEAVADEDRQIASAAVRGLRVWGRRAEIAVPHLMARLKSEVAGKEMDSRWENELRVALMEELRCALNDSTPKMNLNLQRGPRQ